MLVTGFKKSKKKKENPPYYQILKTEESLLKHQGNFVQNIVAVLGHTRARHGKTLPYQVSGIPET